MANPIDPEIADLERQMAELTGSEVPPEPEPPPVESAEAPAAEEVAAEPIEQEAEAVAEEQPEPEEATWRAKYEKLQQHASRLAAKLDYEKRLHAGAPADVPISDEGPRTEYDPNTGMVTEYGETVEERVDRLEREAADRRVNDEIKAQEAQEQEAKELAAGDAESLAAAEQRMAGVDPDIQAEVAARYREAWQQEVVKEFDPAQRVVNRRALSSIMVAEANEAQYARQHERLANMKSASTVAHYKQKIAASVSGSGSVPAPPPKPTSFADMTAEEADKWLRSNVR